MYGVFADAIPMSNVYQFYLATGSTPVTFQEIVDELAEVVTDILTNLVELQWDGFVWDSYSVATLDDDEVSGKVQLFAPIPGVQTGEPLPSQTTIQLRWATGHSRRILKKAYMGLREANSVAATGQFNTTTLGLWAAFGDSLMETLEATNSAWLYCYSSTAPVTTGSLVFPRSGAVSATPKVQRRRRYAN
jgi:hypothetical protein